MSSDAPSHGRSCQILVGPTNFQIWKLRITALLRKEGILGIVDGTEPCPQPNAFPSPNASDIQKWKKQDEKAHGIIQEHISDALLLKTQYHATSKALYDELVTLHQTLDAATAFSLFQRLLASAWDGFSNIRAHIMSIRIVASQLSSMQFPVESRFLASILLNSLPKTSDWDSFTSLIIDTIDSNKFTFDNVEVWITSECICQSLSDTPDSASKAKSSKALSEKWCEHHQASGHDSEDCITYNKWLATL